MKGAVFLWIAGFSVALLSCGTSTHTPCSDQNPCVKGYACSREGACVSAETLSITNDQLPEAFLHKGYSAQIDAFGGIEPYTFFIQTDLAWLSIDPSSGILSGTPNAVLPGTKVMVSLSDSSFGSGKTVSREFLLAVFECIEDTEEACFQPEPPRCNQGLRYCSGHQWSECTGLSLSMDLLHCGPQCFPCDSSISNRCHDGICFCGGDEYCQMQNQICCQKQPSIFGCIDTSSDPQHCGSCQTDCVLSVLHVNQILCTESACNYDSCQFGFLDCDHDGTNGCEIPFGDLNCGACGVDCAQEVQNASDPHCAPEGRCAYGTCYPTSLDCDQNTHNGCEAWIDDPKNCGSCENDCTEQWTNFRCVWNSSQGYFCGCQDISDCSKEGPELCCDSLCFSVASPEHCGSCDISCLGHPEGSLCVQYDLHQCGCSQQESTEDNGCPENSLCCGPEPQTGSCRVEGDQNCGGCDLPCDVTRGGPRCNPPKDRCECQSDTECHDWPFDAEHCVSIQTSPDPYSQCRCGTATWDPICEGGPDSRCCESGTGLACIDTNTNNLHCGRCSHACSVNTNGIRVACSSGRCQCNLDDPELPKADCPGNGPAPDCVGYTCRCLTFEDGTLPCSQGRFCCHGDQGGSGGLGGAADTGCCSNPCGENQEGECLVN